MPVGVSIMWNNPSSSVPSALVRVSAWYHIPCDTKVADDSPMLSSASFAVKVPGMRPMAVLEQSTVAPSSHRAQSSGSDMGSTAATSLTRPTTGITICGCSAIELSDGDQAPVRARWWRPPISISVAPSVRLSGRRSTATISCCACSGASIWIATGEAPVPFDCPPPVPTVSVIGGCNSVTKLANIATTRVRAHCNHLPILDFNMSLSNSAASADLIEARIAGAIRGHAMYSPIAMTVKVLLST